MSLPIASKVPLASTTIRATWLQPQSLRAKLHFNHQPSWNHTRQLPARRKPPIRAPIRAPRRKYSKKTSANTQPNPTPNLGSPEPHSFTARLKKLSREYGYTVIGVYLALTVLDLPFCLLAVKYIGAERVAHAEHVIVGGAKDLISKVFPGLFEKETERDTQVEAAQAGQEAFENQTDGPTIWTQLAMAFVIHKSFIFIRVPLTAAVTPKVVKTLRGWGYNIGKRTQKKK